MKGGYKPWRYQADEVFKRREQQVLKLQSGNILGIFERVQGDQCNMSRVSRGREDEV